MLSHPSVLFALLQSNKDASESILLSDFKHVNIGIFKLSRRCLISTLIAKESIWATYSCWMSMLSFSLLLCVSILLLSVWLGCFFGFFFPCVCVCMCHYWLFISSELLFSSQHHGSSTVFSSLFQFLDCQLWLETPLAWFLNERTLEPQLSLKSFSICLWT